MQTSAMFRGRQAWRGPGHLHADALQMGKRLTHITSTVNSVNSMEIRIKKHLQ